MRSEVIMKWSEAAFIKSKVFQAFRCSSVLNLKKNEFHIT